MCNEGMLLIISGPSGSGKGTVVKNLDKTKGYALSISVTTRNKRKGEVDGKDYFFCSEEEFNTMRENNQLLEHAVFCGNYYGTPVNYVQEQIKKGKVVVLEIDVNGALQVKEKFKDSVLVFLMPPNKDELRKRLINRNTETPDVIEKRLKRASEEIKLVNKYNYLVVNEEIYKTVSDIYTIVTAEKLKPERNLSKINVFKGD